MNPIKYYEFEHNKESYVVPKEWLAEHNKQIRDEVIKEIENFVNGICEYPPTSLLGKKEMLDKLKRMKWEQKNI